LQADPVREFLSRVVRRHSSGPLKAKGPSTFVHDPGYGPLRSKLESSDTLDVAG
jgi:hypothetical protein